VSVEILYHRVCTLVIIAGIRVGFECAWKGSFIRRALLLAQRALERGSGPLMPRSDYEHVNMYQLYPSMESVIYDEVLVIEVHVLSHM
jgi:hypothetical protein